MSCLVFGRARGIAPAASRFCLHSRAVVTAADVKMASIVSHPGNPSFRSLATSTTAAAVEGHNEPEGGHETFDSEHMGSMVISIEEAVHMPREYCEYSNSLLLTLAADGDHQACRERLAREIMFVDKVSWEDAQTKLQEINSSNQSVLVSLSTLPLKITGIAALGLGLATIPLCFDLPTAIWFNDAYVTTEVPKDEDLETWLEVGGWTWNWMEPPLGQASFFILCLEFTRRQMDHLGIRPYLGFVKAGRMSSLQNTYPQYNKIIVGQFADTAPLS